MTPARHLLPWLALGALALSLAGPASAVVESLGGQADYEMPLRAFDLHSFRSPTTDAQRSQAETGLSNAYGGVWNVYSWNPQSQTPSEMYGSGVDVTGPLTSAEVVRAEAERIIEENAATFRGNLEGLRFQEVTSAPPVEDSPDGIRRPGKWAAHFRQVYHDIDVVGGEMHLTFTDTGRLFALGSTYYQDISVDWTPGITADQAKEIARAALPYDPDTDSIEDAVKLLILPVPTSETAVEHHLVWEARVRTEEPLGIWITSVDAHSGEILQRTNGIEFVNYLGSTVGQMERYSYCDGSVQEAYPYVRVSVLLVGSSYADANGAWVVPYGGTDANTLYARLLSPYVDVENSQGPWAGIFATVFPGVPYQANFNNANSRADERDTFKTVGDVHNFFETFAPGWGFTNQVITARVNINDTCNAYWDGVTINFYQAGGGCGNTGQMMDIVAHEYGHGVQGAILGNGAQGGEGLGEGNADVTGFLMTLDSQIGKGFFGCSPGGSLRDCNNTLRYPGDVVGQEIHDAGRVIAGFHWDAMWDQIADYGIWGRYSTAWDWHWGRVLQHPMTQPAQVLATFIANDDDGNLTNGTPQFNSYCLAATNHGFTCPVVTLPLAAGGCDTYHQSPQGYTMNQQNNYWTVAGVSPAPGDDKDISVYTAGYVTLLASSQGVVGTDFVVGDFNHNPLGVYQPYVSYGGATSPYVTEWDSGPDQISIGTDIFGSVGGGDGNCGLVRIWDVFLTAGTTYTVGLLNNGGNADMRLSLFRNPAAAPYWAGRNSAAIQLAAGNSVEYTAPTSDWYGVVVFNNSQGPSSGSYVLRVQNAPTVLASAVCQSSTSSPRMFKFNQGVIYWTGVAVNPSGADDKDITVYADPAGAGPPLASSLGVVGTDFVVGDFNHNALGTYYSRVSYGEPAASYVTEWDSGTDTISPGVDVNGSVGGGAGGCGLIQVSDMFLTAGHRYQFLLTKSGVADIRVSLFRNPASSTYWARRSSAEFEAVASDPRIYVTPADDWYGVVVFNNSPGSPAGNYTLRVEDLGPTAVGDEVADAEFGITFQNPYPTGSPILLSAAAEGTGAQVGIYNVQGQLVRTLLNEPVGTAGRQLAWDGRTDGGVKVGVGIYLLHARIGSTLLNRTLLMMR